jgi:putative tryptophan/tyrosine transport system substrate-binding protein
MFGKRRREFCGEPDIEEPTRMSHLVEARMNGIVGVVALLAAWLAPDFALTQDLKTIAVVCHCRADFPTYKAFEEGLATLGWQDGRSVRIVRRFSDGNPALLTKNAEEMVALKPHVIFAGFTPAVIAVQKHTTVIPVVFAGVSDASEIGAATHMNRPEHNFTGPITINRELMPKRLELLKEALPKLSTAGYLANPQYALHEPQLREMQAAAQKLNVNLTVAPVTAAAELESAFTQLIANGAQGVVVQQDPVFTGQSARIVALAEMNRLPAIYALRGFYDAGGLMWYGADIPAMFRRAADYVDRILKGTPISELPVERPTKIYLTVNAKLAQRLGLELSPAFLTVADEVLE